MQISTSPKYNLRTASLFLQQIKSKYNNSHSEGEGKDGFGVQGPSHQAVAINHQDNFKNSNKANPHNESGQSLNQCSPAEQDNTFIDEVDESPASIAVDRNRVTQSIFSNEKLSAASSSPQQLLRGNCINRDLEGIPSQFQPGLYHQHKHKQQNKQEERQQINDQNKLADGVAEDDVADNKLQLPRKNMKVQQDNKLKTESLQKGNIYTAIKGVPMPTSANDSCLNQKQLKYQVKSDQNEKYPLLSSQLLSQKQVQLVASSKVKPSSFSDIVIENCLKDTIKLYQSDLRIITQNRDNLQQQIKFLALKIGKLAQTAIDNAAGEQLTKDLHVQLLRSIDQYHSARKHRLDLRVRADVSFYNLRVAIRQLFYDEDGMEESQRKNEMEGCLASAEEKYNSKEKQEIQKVKNNEKTNEKTEIRQATMSQNRFGSFSNRAKDDAYVATLTNYFQYLRSVRQQINDRHIQNQQQQQRLNIIDAQQLSELMKKLFGDKASVYLKQHWIQQNCQKDTQNKKQLIPPTLIKHAQSTPFVQKREKQTPQNMGDKAKNQERSQKSEREEKPSKKAKEQVRSAQKDSLLNDLKKFSQNYKLPSK